uniref:KIB1-4 beta-propeller domain-containing protein n=1 Tax=Tanacetum cinerariifolium TaxID=118510 RepID=A0A6L2NY42_TANCI|nr:hypothetical protein [Tanacetum cinerariifolium]
MMEWSEMLPEVLDIITQKYITCYEDYLSFAGVCKSWCLAAARIYHNSNGPPSRLPSLMLAEKSDDHESRELFLLSNKRIRKIRLPEIYGKACWYSSCGWLLTVGKDFALQLINPLSREIINLPKIDTFSEAIHPINWEYTISKFLLLESKSVLIIWEFKKLGFCHIGDNKWTSIDHGLDNHFIHDITFYNGQIYTFYLNNTIRACNVNGKDRAVLVHLATIPEDVYYRRVFLGYIVGLDDGERKQLLVISRYLMFKEGIYYTKSFKVFAYDLESGNWSRVTDFDGSPKAHCKHYVHFLKQESNLTLKRHTERYCEKLKTNAEAGQVSMSREGVFLHKRWSSVDNNLQAL